MSVSLQSDPPGQFSAGDSLSFTVSGSVYSPATHYMDFRVMREGTALFNARGTSSNGDFLFSITGTTTSVFPGPADWVLVATPIAGGARYTVDSGVVAILFNPEAPAQAPSQASLDLCKAAIDKLLTTGNVKVEFDGQMFERDRIKNLYAIRDRLQAKVSSELRQMGYFAQGGSVRLQTRFGQ